MAVEGYIRNNMLELQAAQIVRCELIIHDIDIRAIHTGSLGPLPKFAKNVRRQLAQASGITESRVAVLDVRGSDVVFDWLNNLDQLSTSENVSGMQVDSTTMNVGFSAKTRINRVSSLPI